MPRPFRLFTIVRAEHLALASSGGVAAARYRALGSIFAVAPHTSLAGGIVAAGGPRRRSDTRARKTRKRVRTRWRAPNNPHKLTKSRRALARRRRPRRRAQIVR